VAHNANHFAEFHQNPVKGMQLLVFGNNLRFVKATSVSMCGSGGSFQAYVFYKGASKKY
jgi:hypothetical protein